MKRKPVTFHPHCFRCHRRKPDTRTDWYCPDCRRIVDELDAKRVPPISNPVAGGLKPAKNTDSDGLVATSVVKSQEDLIS